MLFGDSVKKLLIHIGTGKTGTTSIQRSLLVAQRLGTLGPVCYPDVLKSKWRSPNPHAFLGYVYRPRHVPGIFRPKDRQDALKALIPEFRRDLEGYFLKNDNIILSTEYLAACNQEEIVRFRKDLEQYAFSDVAVIVYVRNPADFYLSAINQNLRKSPNIVDPRRFRYQFRRAVSRWSDAFDGKIIVRPFDRSLFRLNCVVQDFVQVASGFFSREMGPVESLNSNESLSAEAMVLLQKYRRFRSHDTNNLLKRDAARLRKILVESAQALPQTKARLRRGVEALITERHKDDLSWLHSQHGIDFRPQSDGAAPDWKPPRRGLQVEDIVESRSEIVDQLLLYALQSALGRRSAKRGAARERRERIREARTGEGTR